MATRCPSRKSILLRNATHEDMTGFIAAATTTGSLPSGRTTLRSSCITVRSVIVPSLVSSRIA